MAERVNFTKAKLKALEPPRTGRKYVYDEQVPNLCVCVTEKGTMTWYRYGRVNGEPQRYRIGRVEEWTIQQARDECRRLNGEIAERKDPMQRRRQHREEKTVQELFDWVLEHHSKPNKKTWKRDESEYNQKVKKKFGSRKISTLTSSEIREHHNFIKETLGPYAANKMREILRLIYSIAKTEGWIERNPVDSVPKAKTSERERFLSAEELAKWFEAVGNLQRETTRDFLLMALFTGARRDNVCSMRWDEIDFERAIWTIPGAKFKNGNPVAIVLVEQAMGILSRRKDESESEWVFPGGGRTGHLVEPKAAWQQVCKQAGLTDVRLHDLRRTFGSWQAAAGTPLQIIGKSLGHKSQSATHIYARLDLDPVRVAVSAAVNAMQEASKKFSKKDEHSAGTTEENAESSE